MSRTYKDRPYWVRINDPKEATYNYHDHLIFGREDRYLLNGKVVIDRFYSDYCTVNTPDPNPRSYTKGEQSPCGKVLGYGRNYWRSGGRKKDRKGLYFKPLRSRERTFTTNAVKDYNSFQEIDEDYFLREKTLNSPYDGGYWD